LTGQAAEARARQAVRQLKPGPGRQVSLTGQAAEARARQAVRRFVSPRSTYFI
jgi:hypothetical protein